MKGVKNQRGGFSKEFCIRISMPRNFHFEFMGKEGVQSLNSGGEKKRGGKF